MRRALSLLADADSDVWAVLQNADSTVDDSAEAERWLARARAAMAAAVRRANERRHHLAVAGALAPDLGDAVILPTWLPWRKLLLPRPEPKATRRRWRLLFARNLGQVEQ